MPIGSGTGASDLGPPSSRHFALGSRGAGTRAMRPADGGRSRGGPPGQDARRGPYRLPGPRRTTIGSGLPTFRLEAASRGNRAAPTAETRDDVRSPPASVQSPAGSLRGGLVASMLKTALVVAVT